MCITSVVMQEWARIIPQPLPYMPQPITITAPDYQVAPDLTNHELAELIKTFFQAKEAAEKADELTGQPDCVDPEKAQLLERIEELENRLALIEGLATGQDEA